MSIYALKFEDTILYIGSTFEIRRRFYKHKTALKTGTSRPLYNYLRLNNITFDDIVIDIIGCDFTDKKLLLESERMLIEYWKPLCNKNMPGRTQKEYYIDNKLQISVYKAKYYIEKKHKHKQEQELFEKQLKIEMDLLILKF